MKRWHVHNIKEDTVHREAIDIGACLREFWAWERQYQLRSLGYDQGSYRRQRNERRPMQNLKSFKYSQACSESRESNCCCSPEQNAHEGSLKANTWYMTAGRLSYLCLKLAGRPWICHHHTHPFRTQKWFNKQNSKMPSCPPFEPLSSTPNDRISELWVKGTCVVKKGLFRSQGFWFRKLKKVAKST
jgi:hypothetical protein